MIELDELRFQSFEIFVVNLFYVVWTIIMEIDMVTIRIFMMMMMVYTLFIPRKIQVKLKILQS